jgi:hypothetical protein
MEVSAGAVVTVQHLLNVHRLSLSQTGILGLVGGYSTVTELAGNGTIIMPLRVQL